MEKSPNIDACDDLETKLQSLEQRPPKDPEKRTTEEHNGTEQNRTEQNKTEPYRSRAIFVLSAFRVEFVFVFHTSIRIVSFP